MFQPSGCSNQLIAGMKYASCTDGETKTEMQVSGLVCKYSYMEIILKAHICTAYMSSTFIGMRNVP